MKISLNWLQDFIELTETDPQKIANVLTEKSAEVDAVINMADDLENIVLGEIKSIEKHPDADALSVCMVNVGEPELLQIICGGSNLSVNQKVVVSKIGASVKWHGEGDSILIKKTKIRGIESYGMICASDEIGQSDLFPKSGEKEIIDASHLDFPIGTPFAKCIEMDDVIFDIDNTAITNRPDLFSHIGFAREFVACGLATWRSEEEEELSVLEEKLSEDLLPIDYKVESDDICSIRADVTLDGIEIKESPNWMKKRLKACGIRAINNVVDISNYVMLETGMPLHIFDLESIAGKKMTMRESVHGEKIITLDGQERELPDGVIIHEDAKNIIDLAGIMGAKNSEVTENTNQVLVHVPVYNPIKIRKAALHLGHRTDAATIYEKRVPNASVYDGVFRSIELLLELCPNAKITSEIEIEEQIPDENRLLILQKKVISRVLGKEISDTEIHKILTDLGFKILSQNEDIFEIEVPEFRYKDISLPEDIVEEIIRIHGLNDIHPIPPKMEMRKTSISPVKKIRYEITDFLVSEQFYELLTLSFLGNELLQKCGFSSDETYIELENPLSEDLSLMRQSLLPRLLEKSEENRRYRENFRVFEIGKVFHLSSPPDKGELEGVLKTETLLCSGLLVGEDFYIAKGILESLFEILHLPYRLEDKTGGKNCLPPIGDDSKLFGIHTAGIFSGKDQVGELFEIKKSLRKKFDLPEKAAVFTLNLTKLSEYKRTHKRVKALPKFPGVELDLSVLADANVPVEKVAKAVKGVDPLVVSVQVLEIFEGKNIPKGKKSVTLHFEFRSPERTLEGEEVEKLKAKILEKLEKSGYPFRF